MAGFSVSPQLIELCIGQRFFFLCEEEDSGQNCMLRESNWSNRLIVIAGSWPYFYVINLYPLDLLRPELQYIISII